MTIMSTSPQERTSTDVFRGFVPGAPGGVQRVELIVRNLTTGLHLQPDGSMGHWTVLTAFPGADDYPATEWSYPPAPLPPGSYYVQTRRIAKDGHRSPWRRTDHDITN